MSHRHDEKLGQMTDIHHVTAYGYGYLRELCKAYSNREMTKPEFTRYWQQAVAAVEFRTAELAAEALGARLANQTGLVWAPHPRPKADTTAIYAPSEECDERTTED